MLQQLLLFPVPRQDAGILNQSLLEVSPDLTVNTVCSLGYKWIHSRSDPGLGTKKCEQAYCDQAPIPPANHRLMLKTNSPVRLGHKWKYSCEPGALAVNQGCYVSPPTKTKKVFGQFCNIYLCCLSVTFIWDSYERIQIQNDFNAGGKFEVICGPNNSYDPADFASWPTCKVMIDSCLFVGVSAILNDEIPISKYF